MKQVFRLYTSERRFVQKYVRPALAGFTYKKQFGNNKHRILFIYYPSNVALSQVDPFFYYQSALCSRFNLEFRALSLAEFMRPESNGIAGADVVFLQTRHDLDADNAVAIFDVLKKRHPDANVIFLDWFAPLDLRFASILNERILSYIKKQVFRDFSRYKTATSGETNLVEYYGHLYGLRCAQVSYDVPSVFRDKLTLGPGFFTSLRLISGFIPESAPRGSRPIDVNARITVQKSDWYGMMRKHACAAAQSIAGRRVVTEFSLSRKRFLSELRESKLCFSPFGYGEVCWRDYEAMMTGSVLLKPDVSHLITEPNIFIPGQTYVPIAWDFSDLREKAEYYIRNDDEREMIAANAYAVIHDYVVNDRFMQFAERVFGSSQILAAR